MKLAKVRRFQPYFLPIADVNTDSDRLMNDIYKGEVLFAPRKTVIDEKLITKLQNYGRQKLWVRRPYEDWTKYEEAVNHEWDIIEVEHQASVKESLLSDIKDINDLETLYYILENLESSESDGSRQTIESLQESIRELQDTEEELLDVLAELDDNEVTEEALSVLNNEILEVSKDEIPDGYQSLFRDLFNYISDLRDTRSSLIDTLVKDDHDGSELEDMDFTEDDGLEASLRDDVSYIKDVRDIEGETLDFNEELKSELFSSVSQKTGHDAIDDLYQSISQLFSIVIEQQHYSPNTMDNLKDALDRLVSDLPELNWALPRMRVNEQSLILQAITRLITYGQVWPDDLLDEQSEHLISGLLFGDISLATDYELFQDHTRSYTSDLPPALREHPDRTVGYLDLVSKFPREALMYILYHHEKPEGEGYPREINLEDRGHRLQKVVLIYHYVLRISSWPWQSGMTPHEAVNRIWKDLGGCKTGLLAEFVSKVGSHPTGSKVELSNGKEALIERQTGEPDQPVVRKITRSETRKVFLSPEVDLTDRDVHLTIPEPPKEPAASWKLRRARF